jgi:hypothetical protein
MIPLLPHSLRSAALEMLLPGSNQVKQKQGEARREHRRSCVFLGKKMTHHDKAIPPDPFTEDTPAFSDLPPSSLSSAETEDDVAIRLTNKRIDFTMQSTFYL